MSTRTRFVAAALVAAALVAAPGTAQACWDGVYVEGEKVSIAIATDEGDTAWTPERARAYAKWIGRIGALVPDGTTMSIEHGYISICDDATRTCRDAKQSWDDPYLSNLFELTADLMQASRGTIAKARRTEVMPLTVQVAASQDFYAATAMAERINGAGLQLTGFLDVGGFPSANEYAFVVEDYDSDTLMYHVVVGSYLDRADAKAAAVALDEELGLSGFVRTLDQHSPDSLGC